MRKRDPNRIEMGRRFREARERLNWSREVLAERADLSVSFIADLELGNTGTRLELIHELRLMQCYLMPDETALRELSVVVIEKLKLLTDAEFAELEFPLD